MYHFLIELIVSHNILYINSRAIRDCMDAVMPAIPYCIDLIEGAYLTTNESKIVAFRPKG